MVKILSFLYPICLLFFLYALTIPVSGESPSFYIPKETFFIDCGAPQDKAWYGRNWIGDIYSQFFPAESGKTGSTSSVPADSIDNPLFSTARLSHSEFTYVFPVSPGPKYIRLHFYPSSYGAFNRSKASFSVKTGGYTLMTDFNASLAADVLGSLTVYKEFVIYFKDKSERLNISFNPTDRISGAYAFINGIEVVSMPEYLYYTSSLDQGFQFIGQENLFFLEADYALENVYRLNVGGKSLSPMEDTGMFRTWEADDDYCVKLAFVPANTSINLKFTQIPNYTAPVEVYQTARTMGPNSTENRGDALTWVLPVDSGFSYLLRLHFCEFLPEIQRVNEREFEILIANQTAERSADVIAWTGGNGVPIYRDYGVMMPSQGSDKKQNLYIQLHPSTVYSPLYNDAILNGIELFKLSDPENALGEDFKIPSTVAQPTSRGNNKMRESNKMKKLVAIIGGAIGAVVAVPIVCFFVAHQKKRNRAQCLGPIKPSHTYRSSLTSDPCCHFSLQEIKTATNNFDKGYIIGEGGFGNVYKGYINNGGVTTPAAIKRLNPDSQQGVNEFMTEIEMLSQLRHIHLVSLVGYCNHKREMILVYEYMANGNLRDHLYNTDNPRLRWTQRLKICIGAARGLHYLHAGVKKPIIHRDVKTTNILLDHKWVAKVSDFGLSKMSPTSVANAHISTVVKGSFGYLDPEYFRFQRLNEKSDVYSFGVVLFEVLCARPPVNVNQTGKEDEEDEQAGLAHWAVSSYKNGKLEESSTPI